MEKDLQHNQMKPYRVRLTATADVAIEVYARSEEAARAKALNWTGGTQEGWNPVGDFEIGDFGTVVNDDDEMHWSIEAISPDSILGVIEIETEDAVKADGEVVLPQESCHEQ